MKPMRLFLLSFFLLCCFIPLAYSQSPTPPNLGFEIQSADKDLPDGWRRWGPDGYSLQRTQENAHAGKWCMRIKAEEDMPKNAFGSVVFTFPAPSKGKKVLLRGYMKTEEVSLGFAGLVLRIDGPGGTLAFNNMQERQIHGSQDWKAYEIELPFPEGAEKINVAGLLTGKGQAWFDGFELFVDGKEIAKTIGKTQLPAAADNDRSFERGTDIRLDGLSSSQIDALYKLGKVWSYVKYRHPAIAEGKHNWDSELFRIVPEVVAAKGSEEVNSIIFNWIPKYTKASKPLKASTDPVKLKADVAWVRDENFLGKELSKLLQGMRLGKDNKKHYYLDFTRGAGNPVFKHEAKYPQMTWEDDGLKLLALYRFWAMVEYYFPNRHLMDEPWDKQLRDFIPSLAAADDEVSYKLTLVQLIGKIQDTHANVWGNDPALKEHWGLRIAPAKLKYVEGKPVVVQLFSPEGESALQIGDVILEVDGKSASALADELKPYCPASNGPTQMRNVARKLLRTNADKMRLKVDRNGESMELEIASVEYSRKAFFGKDVPGYRVLEERYGCLYPGKLERGDIFDIMKQLEDTDGLVIDFRCYPSDFIVFSLGRFLVPERTEFVKFSTGSLADPGSFHLSKPLAIGKKNPKFYDKPVVILINEITQSSAEYHTMALRAGPNATVLGSTTAGADGNVSVIYLPGMVKTMISGIGIYYPDGKETQRIGIVPDEKMEPTVAGIRAGRDELMERALEIIKSRQD